MDPSSQPHNSPSVQDEWDTDGYEIPSFGLGDPDQSKLDDSVLESSKPPSPKAEKEENLYRGPDGALHSQPKQQPSNTSSRKRQFKQRLKEADRKVGNAGREDKLENIRELLGSNRASLNTSSTSPRDWLDPHCHESEFEKQHPK